MIAIDRQSSMVRQDSESCGAVIIDTFKCFPGLFFNPLFGDDIG
jgi:hypothetical protein